VCVWLKGFTGCSTQWPNCFPPLPGLPGGTNASAPSVGAFLAVRSAGQEPSSSPAMTSRGAARPNGQSQASKICQFKLVLLGESAVGKSSLVLRFVKGQFHEYQESTIGGESVRGHCLQGAPVPGSRAPAAAISIFCLVPASLCCKCHPRGAGWSWAERVGAAV